MSNLHDPAARDELLQRIESLTPESQRQWGRMSPHGMVCHLNDAFLASFGERDAKGRGNILHRTIIRFIAFSTPMPWPPGAKTLPEFDQEIGGTPPEEFAADVARLRSHIERFHDSKGQGLAPHPVFGSLTKGEWGRWGYRHVDHHLRQFGV